MYEWELNNVPSRATYTEEGKESEWQGSGSIFVHTMRCIYGTTARIAFLGLTCFLVGRSDACGVYVCGNIGVFASLDLIAFWRGGPMQSNIIIELPFDRHKVVIDINFAVWSEVNIEFMEWFLSEIVDVVFCLRYVRKNVRRYVRKYLKKYVGKYVKKNFKRYVRKNIGRYVKKNVKKYIRKNIKRYIKKNFRRYVKKNFRRYVKRNIRKNIKRYVRKNIRRLLPINLRNCK